MLNDEQLHRLYAWIDEIPLSRPKRNISRDFSDGVLLAEVVKHYFPRMVDVHNYPPANSSHQKLYNWTTLNSKVLRKLGFTLSKDEIEEVIQSKPGAVEKVIHTLQMKMAKYKSTPHKSTPSEPEGYDEPGGARPRSSYNNHTVSSSKKTIEENRSRAMDGAATGTAAHIPHDELPAAPDQRQRVRVSNHRRQQQQQQGGGEPKNKGKSTAQPLLDLEEDLLEKDLVIQDLKETVEILELKISKLDQLVRVKDAKIGKLQEALSEQTV